MTLVEERIEDVTPYRNRLGNAAVFFTSTRSTVFGHGSVLEYGMKRWESESLWFGGMQRGPLSFDLQIAYWPEATWKADPTGLVMEEA